MSIPLQPVPEDQRVPGASYCDMDQPKEHVLWALMNIGELAGAPMLMPLEEMHAWSEHLYRAGFRHQPELQEIYYNPPVPDADLFDGSFGGKWVHAETLGENPIKTPPPADVTVGEFWDGLTPEVQQAITEYARKADKEITGRAEE